jgi:hypothetical protein
MGKVADISLRSVQCIRDAHQLQPHRTGASSARSIHGLPLKPGRSGTMTHVSSGLQYWFFRELRAVLGLYFLKELERPWTHIHGAPNRGFFAVVHTAATLRSAGIYHRGPVHR